MKAEIITIGDEILLGQIVDSNSAWMGQQLDLLGIQLGQITSVSDTREAIYESLSGASERADLVLVTGGLGPTKDDVTKETISAFFNSGLVRNEKVYQHVLALFAKRGTDRPIPERNYAQADVLASCDVLFNDVGTAPGMWLEKGGKFFVFLPGVPFEMKFLMEHSVIPKLKEILEIQQHKVVYHAHILTMGLGESFLADKIADIEDDLPSYIRLAYLPTLGTVRLRLSAMGEDLDELKRSVDAFADRIAMRLVENVVAREDIKPENVIVEEFTVRGIRLATAESCTGGLLASAITSISGASAIFDCGIIAYHNRIKQEVLGVDAGILNDYGAVSEETVVQMAEGVKRISGADYAIATSGVAGPLGGTLDKPVGTVWIAVSGKSEIVTRKFNFRNDRKINIERSVAQALNMLWQLYKKEHA